MKTSWPTTLTLPPLPRMILVAHGSVTIDDVTRARPGTTKEPSARGTRANDEDRAKPKSQPYKVFADAPPGPAWNRQ